MNCSFPALIRECLCLYDSAQGALAHGIHLDPGRVSRVLANFEERSELRPILISKLLAGELLPDNQLISAEQRHAIEMVRWLHDQGYVGRQEVVELLEAIGMPRLSPMNPEDAQLIEQLNKKFPRAERSPSQLHRFGKLLCRYLSRRPHLTPHKLGLECVDGGARVVFRMRKGESLTAPKARKRVIQMIDCLCNPWKMGVPERECLVDLAEANALLGAACMDGLSRNATEEQQLLDELIPWTIRYRTDCLVAAHEPDLSAKTLGDIATKYENKKALFALWKAIRQAGDNLPHIIDPCAFTVGRVLLETRSSTLESACFDIFHRSSDKKRTSITDSSFALVLDKFAFTVGRVIHEARTGKDEVRKRAWQLMEEKSASGDQEIREKYAYVRNHHPPIGGQGVERI